MKDMIEILRKSLIFSKSLLNINEILNYNQSQDTIKSNNILSNRDEIYDIANEMKIQLEKYENIIDNSKSEKIFEIQEIKTDHKTEKNQGISQKKINKHLIISLYLKKCI